MTGLKRVDMADHEGDTGSRCGAEDGLGIFDGVGNRLFDKDIAAVVDRLFPAIS